MTEYEVTFTATYKTRVPADSEAAAIEKAKCCTEPAFGRDNYMVYVDIFKPPVKVAKYPSFDDEDVGSTLRVFYGTATKE